MIIIYSIYNCKCNANGNVMYVVCFFSTGWPFCPTEPWTISSRFSGLLSDERRGPSLPFQYDRPQCSRTWIHRYPNTWWGGFWPKNHTPNIPKHRTSVGIWISNGNVVSSEWDWNFAELKRVAKQAKLICFFCLDCWGFFLECITYFSKQHVISNPMVWSPPRLRLSWHTKFQGLKVGCWSTDWFETTYPPLENDHVPKKGTISKGNFWGIWNEYVRLQGS